MTARYGTISDPAVRSQHRIRWFVIAGGEKMPHTAKMRGTWGWEAECSCGWKTRTGGGVHSWVEDLVKDHKWDVENGFADTSASV